MGTILDRSISYILEDNLINYRQLILEYKKPIAYPRGKRLSQCGSPVDCLFFLLDGLVKVYTCNVSGYTRIVGYHKKNTLFAMDNLTGGSLSTVTTECITPVQAVPLYERDLIRLQERDASFYPSLLRYYCTVLRLMCFDAENQSINNTAARLANFFCIYRNSHEYQYSGYISMTQDELASAVNASRVQVARICSEFRKKKIIRIEYKKFFVLDWDSIIGIVNTGRV